MLRKVLVIGVVLAIWWTGTAQATPLTGTAARNAIGRYIANGVNAGVTSGGVINGCQRRSAHRVGCSITEYNVRAVDVDGSRYEIEEMTHGISAIQRSGELRLYDSLFGRVA